MIGKLVLDRFSGLRLVAFNRDRQLGRLRGWEVSLAEYAIVILACIACVLMLFALGG